MLTVSKQKFLIALARAGMTTTELETKSGVGRSTISKILNGNSNVRPAIVGKLAKALNVEVEKLIEK